MTGLERSRVRVEWSNARRAVSARYGHRRATHIMCDTTECPFADIKKQ